MQIVRKTIFFYFHVGFESLKKKNKIYNILEGAHIGEKHAYSTVLLEFTTHLTWVECLKIFFNISKKSRTFSKIYILGKKSGQ
jgi:hypothetical protein